MINSVDQIIYRTTRKKEDPINCAYFVYDGLYEYLLSQTVPQLEMYAQDKFCLYEFRCGDWPKQVHIFSKTMIGHNINVDFVFSNQRLYQSEEAYKLTSLLNCPMITFDHDLPKEDAPKKIVKYHNEELVDSIMVSPHKVCSAMWDYDLIDKETFFIPYGIPQYEPQEKDIDVCIIGEFSEQDRSLFLAMKKVASTKKLACLGYNQGITEEYDTIDQVINIMARSKVCMTASNQERPPFWELIAAANGCLVVTNDTPYTRHIFEHGKTAILFNNISELKEQKKNIHQARTLMQISNNGMAMVRSDFSQDSAKEGWNNLLNVLLNRIYIK